MSLPDPVSIHSEHLPAAIAGAAVMVLATAVATRLRAMARRPRLRAVVAVLQGLGWRHALVGAILAYTAAVHLVLALADREDPLKSLLFLAAGAGFLTVAAALVTGYPWRLPALGLLAGTLVAYLFYLGKGWETLDLLGTATKLLEVLALGLMLSPERRPRVLALVHGPGLDFSLRLALQRIRGQVAGGAPLQVLHIPHEAALSVPILDELEVGGVALVVVACRSEKVPDLDHLARQVFSSHRVPLVWRPTDPARIAGPTRPVPRPPGPEISSPVAGVSD